MEVCYLVSSRHHDTKIFFHVDTVIRVLGNGELHHRHVSVFGEELGTKAGREEGLETGRTVDMVFTAQQLQEKCREQHQDLFMALDRKSVV